MTRFEIRCLLPGAVLVLLPLFGGCGTLGLTRKVPVERAQRTSPSGIRFVDLRTGDGAPAIHGSKVWVHYVASVEGEAPFDSSYDRGNPLVFTIGAGEVVPGWEEGMLGMFVGGRRDMTLPPETAYGSEGLADMVPPDARIRLEVELLKVEGP